MKVTRKKVPVKVILNSHLDKASVHIERAMHYYNTGLSARATHALDNYQRHIDGAIEQITRPS